MFESLTHAEQLERLTMAASAVLAQFGLAGAEVRPVVYIHNAVFAVTTASGEQFALRLLRPGSRPDGWLRSELDWLEAINRETRLCVPRPLRTTSGEHFALAQVAGLDEPLRASVLHWLAGDSLSPEAMTPHHAGQLGRFLAELHRFSAIFRPGPGFARPRLDWEGLFGAQSQYNPGAGARIFTPEHITVFDAVADRVRVTMNTLGQSPASFGLIHGDFIAKNILFRGETICALDFDTSSYGYYLYDLAPLLLQWSALKPYETLKAALWAGYTAVRPLPDEQQSHVETFVAARHVASCRWIASNLSNPAVSARAPQIIATRVEELRDYLQTGRVERRSEML